MRSEYDFSNGDIGKYFGRIQMCEACLAGMDEPILVDVVPGFNLYRATNDVEHLNIKIGDYGLIHLNGPSFVFFREALF